MIKTTISEILESKASLEELLKKELPAVVSYRIAKTTRKIDTELRDFNVTKKKLIEKYGEEIDGTGTTKVTKENMDKFNEEINEVLMEKVELNTHKLNLSDLLSIEITPAILYNLMWLIEENQNEEP